MVEIEYRDVAKTYKQGIFKRNIAAVSDLNLTICRGEVFGLIGPNGAGKSTTIRMLLGLISPDRGSIQYRGGSLAETDFKKNLGYLPENPYLYDHLTLAELLNFCARVSSLEEQTAESRGHELLERLGLLTEQHRPLRTFSKGMLQRAAICFALLHDPALLILDEPMSGLDPIGRKMVVDLVLELKTAGKTIFFCSHILSDVERLCDRIGLMVGGRLVKEFERKDLYQAGPQAICLETAGMPTGVLDECSKHCLKVQALGQRCLLTVDFDGFDRVVKWLRQHHVEIFGTRSAEVSLEDLFIQIVGRGNS